VPIYWRGAVLERDAHSPTVIEPTLAAASFMPMLMRMPMLMQGSLWRARLAVSASWWGASILCCPILLASRSHLPTW